jgi:hypothetical protein
MKLSIILAMLCCLTIACSKNDDGGGSTPTPPAPTKTQLLTQKEWVMKSKQYRKASEATWTDDHAANNPCIQDDRFIYKADGVYQETDGPTKCSPNDPFVRFTGSWTFTQNETHLRINAGREEKIDVLDATTLSVSYDVVNQAGTFHYKVSYGH